MPEKPFAPGKQPGPARGFWAAAFLLCGLVGLAALTVLLSLPSDARAGIFAGISASRATLAGVILIGSLGFIFAAAFAWLRPHKLSSLQRVFLRRRSLRIGVFAGLLVVAISAWLGLVFLHSNPSEANYAYYERLYAPLIWLLLVSHLLALGLAITTGSITFSWLVGERKTLKLAAAILGILVLCGGIVWWSGVGLTPDIAGWGAPGVPLLSWQVCFALIVAVGAFLVCRPWNNPAPGKKNKIILDFVLCSILFLLANLLWQAQPFTPSFFAPKVRPPNFEIYPYSDAAIFDYGAQSVLTGNGFLNGRVVTRPLYLLFLAGLHAIGGQSYTRMIELQTLVLALIPVMMYLLGLSFHSRPAGLAAGLLAMGRELNAIAATPYTEVSNTRMLLSDLPALLGVLVLVYVTFQWIKQPANQRNHPLVCGGLLGLVTLLRSQSLILLIAILPLSLAVYRKRLRSWLMAVMWFGLGLGLTLAPWLVRNKVLTGEMVLDQPSQAAIVAQRFNLTLEEINASNPGDNNAQVLASMLKFTREHPGEVTKFITAHFINNEISALRVLPQLVSLDDYRNNLVVTSLFWVDSSGVPARVNWMLWLLNLIFLTLGLAVCWRRWGWAGLLPLFANLTYNLSVAAGRISGWRFNLPVDWVGYFYLIMGVVQVASWLFRGSENGSSIANLSTQMAKQPETPIKIRSARTVLPVVSAAAVFLLLGSSLPLAELLVPPRYTLDGKAAALERMTGESSMAQNGISVAILEDFLDSPGAVALWGRALYPRFYLPGEAEPGSGWLAYKARSYPHLGFVLISPHGDDQVVFALNDSPKGFANAEDVLVVGCQEEGYVDAAVTMVSQNPGKIIIRQNLVLKGCPLNSPSG